MTLLITTLDQMMFLALLMGLGFVLSKGKFLPRGSAGILSKLENNLFIPALMAGTFVKYCTVETLKESWPIALSGLLLALIPIPLCFLIARFCSKDVFERKTFIYGLVFSNFGFMGNAVVGALFPEYFAQYLIFILPIYIVAYIWAVPVLLIPTGDGKGIKTMLRSVSNPMILCSIAGIIIGLVGIPLPNFVYTALDSAGGCMTPVAMLLTGITIAEMPLGKILRMKSIYVASILRLLVFPLTFGSLLSLLPPDNVIYVCAVCVLSMPLGLSPVVIPAGYGRDTSLAAGMALVSHTLSVITIPLVFSILI